MNRKSLYLSLSLLTGIILLSSGVIFGGFKVLMHMSLSPDGLQVAVVGVSMVCIGLWFLEFSLTKGIDKLKSVYD